VSRYQKDKTNLDFTEARDSEWQWHELGHMQVCTSLQTDNHASTPPLSFLQAGCPSCRPTNSIKAPKAYYVTCALGVNFANIFGIINLICLFTMKLRWLYDYGKSTLYAKIMHGPKLKAVSVSAHARYHVIC